LFDLLRKESLSKVDRERVKLASQRLLDSVSKLIAPLERWTEEEQAQAEVQVFILDHVFESLPTPPFTSERRKPLRNGSTSTSGSNPLQVSSRQQQPNSPRGLAWHGDALTIPHYRR
jgi:hypothetical protein